jgi:plasmid stabilization system protein ParE
MNLRIRKSPFFHSDVIQQYGWYFDKAGEELAWQFFTTVDQTLIKLSRHPDLGRFRHFLSPHLRELHSLQVEAPFRRLVSDLRQSRRLERG